MYKALMAIFLSICSFTAAGNVANFILSSKSEEQRTQILCDIINAAGLPCDPVASFYQGVDTYNAAYWNISCTNGRAYVIQIANDNNATTTIFQCCSMRSLGAQCFKRFGQ